MCSHCFFASDTRGCGWDFGREILHRNNYRGEWTPVQSTVPSLAWASRDNPSDDHFLHRAGTYLRGGSAGDAIQLLQRIVRQV
eukprot:ctg_2045.g473